MITKFCTNSQHVFVVGIPSQTSVQYQKKVFSGSDQRVNHFSLSYMYSIQCHMYHGHKFYQDSLQFRRFVKRTHKNEGLVLLTVKICYCSLVDTA